MKMLKIAGIATLVAAACVAGCTSYFGSHADVRIPAAYGVVQSIVSSNPRENSVNVDASAGSTVDNDKQGRNRPPMFDIRIHLDNGDYTTITQQGSTEELRVGDRVRVVNGQAYRDEPAGGH